jgi:hypothetical protein
MSGLLLSIASRSVEAARDTIALEARAGVRADGPLTVCLSDPPLLGFRGCLDVAGGDLLLERFVAIRIPYMCSLEKK